MLTTESVTDPSPVSRRPEPAETGRDPIASRGRRRRVRNRNDAKLVVNGRNGEKVADKYRTTPIERAFLCVRVADTKDEHGSKSCAADSAFFLLSIRREDASRVVDVKSDNCTRVFVPRLSAVYNATVTPWDIFHGGHRGSRRAEAAE